MVLFIKTNAELKKEGIKLYELGLKKLLEKYHVVISGSYALDVMAWRDLDLFVDVSKINQQDIYEISSQIFNLYQPSWFETKNTFNEDSGCPKGYFLGFETSVVNHLLWNVDIWFTSSNHIKDNLEYVEKLNKKLTNELREIIINIKNKLIEFSLYGEKIFSVDIYQAVLDDECKSYDDFKRWMKKNKGMVLL